MHGRVNARRGRRSLHVPLVARMTTRMGRGQRNAVMQAVKEEGR